MKKKCTKCKQLKLYDDFDWRISNKIKSSHCKSCRSEFSKQRYHKYRSKFRKRIEISNVKMKMIATEIMFSYLLDHPCVDCNVTDLRVLEFDHIRDKKLYIGFMRMHGADSLIDEISKCEIRCANCRRIKTFERAGNRSWRCT